MERIDSRLVYEGRIADVRIDRVRHSDGTEVEREVVVHPGAVSVIAVDERCVYLVRQPREAVGEEALLEIPAGKLDVEGETPLECAKRELREEIGREAGEWEELRRFWVSPGFAEEEMTLFLARGLSEVPGHAPEPDERIEIVPWPLERLDDAIAECRDSKSLLGLQLLRGRLGR